MKIITHSGKFHADEVFASALLSYLFEIPDENIVRTRDLDLIENLVETGGVVVIDVGYRYDPDRLLFDHHQPEFNDTFSEEYDIPLSSCGLVWKHFGKDIVSAFAKEHFPDRDFDSIYEDFYKFIVLAIDAHDNGIKQFSPETELRFQYNPSLTWLISDFNGDDEDARFLDAKRFCFQVFSNKMDQLMRYRIKYEDGLEEFESVFETALEKNLEYMVFDNDDIEFVPYLTKYDPDKRFKIFISKRSENDYRIRTRRKNESGFETLVPLIPEDHAKALIGNNLIFIHKKRFIGGAKTLESAVAIAEASLQN